MAPHHQGPPISQPRFSQHPATHLLQSAGVAIFHVRTGRVVVVNHAREGHWFLPKGRRDVGESLDAAAEREGFEESGYRNRLLPLPLAHLQTYPTHVEIKDWWPNVTEPVWLQMAPVARGVVQKLVYWYIAETVPPDVDTELSSSWETEVESEGDPEDDPFDRTATALAASTIADANAENGEALPPRYRRPPPFPQDITLRDRIAMEPDEYEPRRHPGTGLEEDERHYESHLLSVEEAVQKLREGKRDVQADVVLVGWKGIQKRLKSEAKKEIVP